MSPPLYCFQDETSRSIDGCQRLPGMCYKHSSLYVDHSRQWGLSVAEYEVHLSLRYRDEVWVCSVWRNDDRRLVYWVDAVVREKASFFWRGQGLSAINFWFLWGESVMNPWRERRWLCLLCPLQHFLVWPHASVLTFSLWQDVCLLWIKRMRTAYELWTRVCLWISSVNSFYSFCLILAVQLFVYILVSLFTTYKWRGCPPCRSQVMRPFPSPT